ncbi:ribosomal RNA-processing protein 8 [Contarinia nasturtii]|uniref:ribosomal RNA-processing protein 8 n=1 Tax=Contarinia nasturtii TaxID=265458 RepID=UPI0012D37C00|nr:ribosomal RNA-processing protein 8 [Contarinia nasturtii]
MKMSEPGKYVLLRNVQAMSKKIKKPKQKKDKQLKKKLEKVVQKRASVQIPKQREKIPQQNDGVSKRKNKNKQNQESLKKKSQEVTQGKKQKSRAIVDSSEQPKNFHDDLADRLKASRFRFINEQLYTQTGDEAINVFKEDDSAFNTYHDGYRAQVKQWPINPLDRIINSIKKLPINYVVADFGCGEARLAESVTQKCYSFDLVATNKKVIACNMAHTPLSSESVNVAVFCLSLMGTNLKDFLLEANRVLKIGGHLKIAEIESRFDNVNAFINSLKAIGFDLISKDISTKVFYFLYFKKSRSVTGADLRQLKNFSLKPCLYKKR